MADEEEVSQSVAVASCDVLADECSRGWIHKRIVYRLSRFSVDSCSSRKQNLSLLRGHSIALEEADVMALANHNDRNLGRFVAH